jgi:two-component system, LytTR family, response regulator
VIRVLIVDDERPARNRLRRSLGAFSDVVIGEAVDGADAILQLREAQYDVVFLDVQMPRMNGFEVASALGDDAPAIVFVTAYDEYAVKAFEVEAVDYLLKPFDEARFAAMWERVQRRLESGASADATKRILDRVDANRPLRRLVVREKEEIILVDVDHVTHLTAEGNYVRVHWSGGRPLIRESLAQLEAQLDAGQFTRIHRSAIVNVAAIASLRPFSHGDYTVVLKDGQELRLSRRYASALLG